MAKFSSFYGRKIFHHMFIYFIFSFSIHTPVDISYLDLFNIWSLWMMLESTWGCIYTYRRVNSFPLNKYSKMELLDHMIALKKKKILGPPSILYSILKIQVYISARNKQYHSFLFSKLLATFTISCLFGNSHPNRCEVLIWNIQ